MMAIPHRSKRPKLRTVAEQAGVSLATVSQVLRGTGRISDDTRAKVMAAAKQVNYVQDGRAASMRSGVVHEVGLLIHQIANPFNAEVISGISNQLKTEDFLVSVLDSRDDPDVQHSNLEALIRSARGGLVWVPAMDTPESTLTLLDAHPIPSVTFLRHAQNRLFDHVGIKNFDAVAMATEYLADLGHQKIAFLGGESDVESRGQRIKGYQSAMEARELATKEGCIVYPCPDSKLAGRDAMIALHQAYPEVTAIVCNGDTVALGACLGLNILGLTVGQDISVVGFDNISDAALAIPPLTTLSVAPYELGKQLAKVLLERIKHPNQPNIEILVPAKLVVRATTGKCQTLLREQRG